MIKKFVASLFLSALLATASFAQTVKTSPVWQAQGKLASAVSVTTSSAPTQLPTPGFVAWVCNTGSNDAYIAFGTSNAVTATVAGSSWLKASTCAAYDLNPQIGMVYSYLAAITASSTASLNVETGAGAPPTQASSSGGGGGAITAASGAFAAGAMSAGAGVDGWDLTEGAKGDAAWTSGNGSVVAVLKAIANAAAGATPAGANVIGKFGVDQTTPGITNGESIVGVNAATALAGNGATGAGSLRVTIASDNTAFSVNAQPAPVTSGGLSVYFVQPIASDNHAVIKNGAGQVYHIKATNNSATINYLRLYNAGTGFNGCNSATNLVDQWAIPASTSGAGFVEDIAQGEAFATGISICVTSAYATTDTTNATASAMSVSVSYK